MQFSLKYFYILNLMVIVETGKIFSNYYPIGKSQAGIRLTNFALSSHYRSAVSREDMETSLPSNFALSQLKTVFEEGIKPPEEGVIVGVDLGNSKIDISAIGSKSLRILNPQEILLTQKRIQNGNGSGIAFIDGDELAFRMGEGILRLAYETGFDPQRIEQLLIVGMSNGLVVGCEIAPGEFRHRIITEKIKADLAPKQQQAIDEVYEDNRHAHNEIPVNLYNLLVLGSHPAILEDVIGVSDLKKTRLTSVLSFLRHEFSGDGSLPIIKDDMRRFAVRSDWNSEQINRFLTRTGLPSLVFDNTIDNRSKIQVLNDFSVERRTWEFLFSTIEKNLVGVSSDTVSKIIAADENVRPSGLADSVTSVEGTTYDKSEFGKLYWTYLAEITQNNRLLRVTDVSQDNVFTKTDMIVGMNLHRREQCHYIFYPNSESYGILIDRQTGKRIGLDEINQFDDNKKIEMGWAVSLGMIFAIREKIDHMVLNTERVVGYGGTLSRRLNWRGLFAQCFKDFSYLDMPSATQAAVLLVKLKSGEISPEVYHNYWSDPKRFTHVPNETGISRTEEYQNWLVFKQQNQFK